MQRRSNRIELVGPPGVGKTALFNTLLATNKYRALSSLGGVGESRSLRWPGVTSLRDGLRHLFRRRIEGLPVSATLDGEDLYEWNRYLDQILTRVSTNGVQFDKRIALRWILRNLDNAILAETCRASCDIRSRYVLLDKGALVLAENVPGGWHLCPLPALSVFLEARPETIAARLMNRRQTNPTHHGKSFQQLCEASKASLRNHQEGAMVLRQRDAQVLVADTERDLATVAEEVSECVRLNLP